MFNDRLKSDGMSMKSHHANCGFDDRGHFRRILDDLGEELGGFLGIHRSDCLHGVDSLENVTPLFLFESNFQ